MTSLNSAKQKSSRNIYVLQKLCWAISKLRKSFQGPFRRRKSIFGRSPAVDEKSFDEFSSSCTDVDVDVNLNIDNDVSFYWSSHDKWPMTLRRDTSIDDDGRCDVDSSNDDDRKTPTNSNLVDDNLLIDRSEWPTTSCRFRESTLPECRRTSSLVDELLNEIYARFSDVSSKSSVSG